ncbi:MAG: site-2 protease family protein [Candidatus Harrisonbacteria bacterium]|nr:site-2 protease family protein [Candidatus Harrisonbacteria bacterium]
MTILIVIIGISFLIFIHELGHFFVAKKLGLLVEEFGFGFPPRLFSKKIGETVYSFNLLPFGGFVRIYGEEQSKKSEEHPNVPNQRIFYSQPAWKRTLIIVAGVFMNFIIGWLLMSAVFFTGTPQAVLVSDVLPGSAAEAAEIFPQDQVLGFESAGEFVEFINQNRGKEVNLNLLRNGEELTIRVTPSQNEQAALGVAVADAGIPKHSLPASLWEGLKSAVFIIGAIFAAFANLLWGLLTQGQVLVDFVGPIGIFGVANQAGALGFLYLVQLIALISLNLTVINILPFPALDGGRLFFIFLEKIKGSPLSQNFERSANTIGFLLLIFLMIAITVRDVARLF